MFHWALEIISQSWHAVILVRLESNYPGKLILSKTNVQILSAAKNTDPKVQKSVGPYMMHFPLPGVLLSELI